LSYITKPVVARSGNSSAAITSSVRVFTTTWEVKLSNEVGNVDEYAELIHILKTQGTWDTVIIHVAGNGGVAESAAAIASAMQNSRGQVLVYVDGDVYSADAMIAIAGRIVYIRPATMFLFHSASPGMPIADICKQVHGQQDRGQDMEQKCVSFLTHKLEILNTYLFEKMSSVLTAEELQRVKQGFDVTISGAEIAKRVHVEPVQ